MIIYFHYVVT